MNFTAYNYCSNGKKIHFSSLDSFSCGSFLVDCRIRTRMNCILCFLLMNELRGFFLMLHLLFFMLHYISSLNLIY